MGRLISAGDLLPARSLISGNPIPEYRRKAAWSVTPVTPLWADQRNGLRGGQMHSPASSSMRCLLRMDWIGVPNGIRTCVAAGNWRSPGPLDDRDACKSEEPSGLRGCHATGFKPNRTPGKDGRALVPGATFSRRNKLHGRGNVNPTTELTRFVRPGFSTGDSSAKTAELVCSAASGTSFTVAAAPGRCVGYCGVPSSLVSAIRLKERSYHNRMANLRIGCAAGTSAHRNRSSARTWLLGISDQCTIITGQCAYFSTRSVLEPSIQRCRIVWLRLPMTIRLAWSVSAR
jgi:hypothetical protein